MVIEFTLEQFDNLLSDWLNESGHTLDDIYYNRRTRNARGNELRKIAFSDRYGIRKSLSATELMRKKDQSGLMPNTLSHFLSRKGIIGEDLLLLYTIRLDPKSFKFPIRMNFVLPAGSAAA